jgi:hypothetical protein
MRAIVIFICSPYHVNLDEWRETLHPSVEDTVRIHFVLFSQEDSARSSPFFALSREKGFEVSWLDPPMG